MRWREEGGQLKPEITYLEVGDLAMDTDTARVTRAGVVHKLTPAEFRTLEILMRRPGVVLSVAHIAGRLYSGPGGGPEGAHAIVRLLVLQLRKKLGYDLIANKRGFGYMLGTVPAQSSAAFDRGVLDAVRGSQLNPQIDIGQRTDGSNSASEV